LFVIDIYHRCVQRRPRISDMVELLHIICDQCHGHVLSVILLKHMKWFVGEKIQMSHRTNFH